MNSKINFTDTLVDVLLTSTNVETSVRDACIESISKLDAIVDLNNQLIQLHWFLTQIASETELDIVTLLTLNAFKEIMSPDACALYIIEPGVKLKQINSLNRDSCLNPDKCPLLKNLIMKHSSSSLKHYDLNFCKSKSCKYKDALSFPLFKRDGNVLGYLVGYYPHIKDRIPSKKQIIIDIFSIQIGLSIESVLLRERMKTLAFTDDLTGLANKRMLFEKLDVEIERYKHAKLKKNDLKGIGCIMLDVDNFKHYNDSFGHLAGDVVLQYIGSLINNSISKFDIGARYGGEEMCIILPGKTLDESILIAETIRKQIAETIFEFSQVTISLGVSHYPVNINHNFANECNGLIQYADTCLYHSKRAGKNKVTSSIDMVKSFSD